MPTLVQFRNFARSTLAAGLSSGDTTLVVTTTHGARFPSLTGGQYFYLVLENAALVREVVRVTARATDSMTVVRGQDGTAAVAWNPGDIVSLRIVAAAMNDAFSSVMNTADNLAGLANLTTARANLGLGTAATRNTTGAGGIIEVGSNAQGTYVRFADGTQICWFERYAGVTSVGVGSLWQTPAISHVFPIAFAGQPNVQVQTTTATGAACWAGNVIRDQFGVGSMTALSVINTAACNLDVMAVGRWS